MNNRPQKQSMSELKLRRVTEHIQRLRDDLARPRVRVSEAAQSLIRYTSTTKDPPVFITYHICVTDHGLDGLSLLACWLLIAVHVPGSAIKDIPTNESPRPLTVIPTHIR